MRLLVSLEKKFQYTSTLFLFGSRASLAESLKSGTAYEIESNDILSTFRTLAMNNYEISLHGSYDSYINHEKMQNEKVHLEKAFKRKINGIRQHFLRFKIPETWNVQEKCGFFYDSSLGFYSTNGFRAGCAMPFQPYDLNNERMLDIVEIPMILMDRSYTKYQGRNLDEARKDILEILEHTRRRMGVGSILWHSHMLDNFGMIGSKDLYRTILKYLSNNNAYVSNMSDFTSWWLDRSKTKLSMEDSNSQSTSWSLSCSREAKDIHLQLAVPTTSKYRVETEPDGVLINKVVDNKFLIRVPELKQGEPINIKVKKTN